MNTKIIGIVILVVVLIGGFIIFTRNNQTAQKDNEATIQEQQSAEISPILMPKKTYTLDEVAEHSVETDCWLAIENKVYDVTEFVGKHPGGKAILGGCGKDATALFNERPTNNKGPHPDTAKAALEKLYIGDLK